MRKRPGKLPTLDTMGLNLLEETDLELNWQRNGLRAYVHFAQILYSANCTSGPSGPKIKPRK